MLVPPPVPVTWRIEHVSHDFSHHLDCAGCCWKGSSYPTEVVELCAERADVVGRMVRVIGAHEGVLVVSVGAHLVPGV